MRIAYRTTDEVNRDAVERLAAAYGAELHALEPRIRVAQGQFDLLIYDFDYLPPDECDAVVQAVVAGQPSCKVVVHGFNLNPFQEQTLKDAGVAVLRHLVPSVFRQVRSARRKRIGTDRHLDVPT
jgi:hypothetical protein